jgi:hypothetical protein
LAAGGHMTENGGLEQARVGTAGAKQLLKKGQIGASMNVGIQTDSGTAKRCSSVRSATIFGKSTGVPQSIGSLQVLPPSVDLLTAIPPDGSAL